MQSFFYHKIVFRNIILDHSILTEIYFRTTSLTENIKKLNIHTCITPPPGPSEQFKNSLGIFNSFPNQFKTKTSNSVQDGLVILSKKKTTLIIFVKKNVLVNFYPVKSNAS